jgi:hypothetical protein
MDMVKYEKIPQRDTSDRAPTGVCELALEAVVSDPELVAAKMERIAENTDTPSIKTYPYTMEDGGPAGRVSVRTGTDRLSVEDFRDLAEMLGGVMEYKKGNIPPGINIIPLTSNGDVDNAYVWFQFDLENELPRSDVESRIRDYISNRPVQPHSPSGNLDKSDRYRLGSVSYSHLRNVAEMATNIRDELDVIDISLICEMD